jgi:hypothetical protein
MKNRPIKISPPVASSPSSPSSPSSTHYVVVVVVHIFIKRGLVVQNKSRDNPSHVQCKQIYMRVPRHEIII